MRVRLLVALALAAHVGSAAPAAARSLADTLHQFIVTNGATIEEGVLDPLTPVIERLAQRGTDLPPTATSFGFTYRFMPEYGGFERETAPLDSIFVEPARTVGRHAVVVGATYQHAALTQFDGDDLADQVTLREPGPPLTSNLQFSQFKVTADVFTTFVTYGLLDDWDVNLLLPVVRTAIDLQATHRVTGNQGSPQTTFPSASDEAVGLGDLLLRTKAHLVKAPLDVAVAFALRAPTGDAADFQGLGDWTLSPGLILGRTFGPHEVHFNTGIEINAGDLERTRVHYALGGSLQPVAGLAFIADVIGSSSFVPDEFVVTSRNKAKIQSTFLEQFRVEPAQPAAGGYRELEAIPRTDIVSFALGAKWNPRSRFFVFASAQLPVTNDGFRAHVIPAVGAQYIF